MRAAVFLFRLRREEKRTTSAKRFAVPCQVFHSGKAPDRLGSGLLKPVTLRYPRGRDAEFLALSAVVAEARRTASEAGVADSAWDLRGKLQLRVSHTPCLSCVAAALQFRRAFPAVQLTVSFAPARL